MRVLVVVAARPEELHRARRRLGYERLVLVAPEGKGRYLLESLGDGQGAAEAEEVPEHDLLACLERIEALLQTLEKEDVRVAVDGGTRTMTAAAFLACLSRGVAPWFFEHTSTTLPVLRALPIGARFSESEAALLGALDGRSTYEALAQRSGLALAEVKTVCLNLRKDPAPLVETDASGAKLTELGAYYQRGLQAPGAR